MRQVQTGEVNGLGLRAITGQEHCQATNGYLPQVGNVLGIGAGERKRHNRRSGLLLGLNTSRKDICSMEGL